MGELYSSEIAPIFDGLISFNKYKVIVEIGVAGAHTTRYLCEFAEKNDGFVYGFDIWERHGLKKQFKSSRFKLEKADELLKSYNLSNYELIKVDTTTKEFEDILKEKCPVIDLAFIDGCHSYQGVKNDFDIVYPLLDSLGTIVFHDTLRIDGAREFMIDLRTIYFDGTFDIIDMPWGNLKRRVGISILKKRMYPTIKNLKIDEICGSPSKPKAIYEKERKWYERDLHNDYKKL